MARELAPSWVMVMGLAGVVVMQHTKSGFMLRQSYQHGLLLVVGSSTFSAKGRHGLCRQSRRYAALCYVSTPCAASHIQFVSGQRV